MIELLIGLGVLGFVIFIINAIDKFMQEQG